MPARRLAALLILQLAALGAVAQEQAEFGRASAGEIALLPKGSRQLSGTLGVNLTEDVFGNRRGAELSAGGTLLKDRLWFFAAGMQQEQPRHATLVLPEQQSVTAAAGAQLRGQLGDAHDFSAFFATERAAAAPFAAPQVTPSTFLSLRYTGIVTDNMYFTATYSGLR